MSIFFSDAALTSPLIALSVYHNIEHNPDPQQRRIYIGTPTIGRKLVNSTDPDVAQLVLSVVDAAIGSGNESAQIKLAGSQAGLAAATPGAPLSLGASIAYGSPAEAWVEISNVVDTVSNRTDLELSVADVALAAGDP